MRTDAAGAASVRRTLRTRGHRYAVVARKAGYAYARTAVALRRAGRPPARPTSG